MKNPVRETVVRSLADRVKNLIEKKNDPVCQTVIIKSLDVTFSHESPSMSTNSLISSGIANAGCVSFN